MDMKYGISLHFGMNTYTNCEWGTGKESPKTFLSKGKPYDTDQWAQVAYAAGASFLMLTTNHHDGFCLWPSAYTDHDIESSSSPPGSDVVRDLANSLAVVNEQKGVNIKLALYYSLWNLHEATYRDTCPEDGLNPPTAPCPIDEHVDFVKKQLTELLDGRYGAIAFILFDGAWHHPGPEWKLDELYDLVKTLQPECLMIVNGTKEQGSYQQLESGEYLLGGVSNHFPTDIRSQDRLMPDSPSQTQLFACEGKTYFLPFMDWDIYGASWFHNSEGYPSASDDISKGVEAVLDHWNKCMAHAPMNNVLCMNMSPDINGEIPQCQIKQAYEVERRLGRYADSESSGAR